MLEGRLGIWASIASVVIVFVIRTCYSTASRGNGGAHRLFGLQVCGDLVLSLTAATVKMRHSFRRNGGGSVGLSSNYLTYLTYLDLAVRS